MSTLSSLSLPQRQRGLSWGREIHGLLPVVISILLDDPKLTVPSAAVAAVAAIAISPS
jgi:hypothetical protein